MASQPVQAVHGSMWTVSLGLAGRGGGLLESLELTAKQNAVGGQDLRLRAGSIPLGDSWTRNRWDIKQQKYPRSIALFVWHLR